MMMMMIALSVLTSLLKPVSHPVFSFHLFIFVMLECSIKRSCSTWSLSSETFSQKLHASETLMKTQPSTLSCFKCWMRETVSVSCTEHVNVTMWLWCHRIFSDLVLQAHRCSFQLNIKDLNTDGSYNQPTSPTHLGTVQSSRMSVQEEHEAPTSCHNPDSVLSWSSTPLVFRSSGPQVLWSSGLQVL